MRAFNRILIVLVALLAVSPAWAQVEEPPSIGEPESFDPEPLVDEDDVETPNDGELVPGTSSDTELPGLEDDDELDTYGEPPEEEDFSGDVDPLDPGEGIGDVDPLPGDEPGEEDRDIGGYEPMGGDEL